VVTALVWISWQPNGASALDLQTVNAAELPQRPAQKSKGFDPAVLRAQVLLDRAGFSPGEIDGRMGENISKAIAAFATARGLKADRQLTPALWSELIATSNDPALIEYSITVADLKGPFLGKVPAKIEDMRGLDRLAYGSAVEALAEKFHMSEGLLKALNPKTSFEAGKRSWWPMSTKMLGTQRSPGSKSTNPNAFSAHSTKAEILWECSRRLLEAGQSPRRPARSK